jgi:hypothetical protein
LEIRFALGVGEKYVSGGMGIEKAALRFLNE